MWIFWDKILGSSLPGILARDTREVTQQNGTSRSRGKWQQSNNG